MAFLIFRVARGVAMGGIWGVASSLAMETIPDRSRWLMSGHFSAGYPAYPVRLVYFGSLRYGELARHVPELAPCLLSCRYIWF